MTYEYKGYLFANLYLEKRTSDNDYIINCFIDDGKYSYGPCPKEWERYFNSRYILEYNKLYLLVAELFYKHFNLKEK